MKRELARLGWAIEEAWDAFWFSWEFHDELRSVEHEATQRRMVDAGLDGDYGGPDHN